ncbi:MAG TPA: hypothetical protein PKJ69_04280 [Spirochaetota bacterium]|nr:hypothetical protein [Spirochaetota bacterium]
MNQFFKTILRIIIGIICCCIVTNNSYSAEKLLSFPVGITYDSIYWWRGVELNGKGAGVIWPKVGCEVSGVQAYITIGINQDYFMTTEEGDNDLAKTYHEFDYGIEYSFTQNTFSSTIGIKYCQYPFYDSADATVDPSFFEAYGIVSFSYVIIPVLELYYDYYREESDEETPVNEDVYAKLSLFKEILHANSFIVKTGIWLGYYHNAYLDRDGFSDAGITLSTSYDYNDVVFFSAVNYARTLSEDFYIEYDADANGHASRLKNHFWVDIGISSKL